MANSGVPDFKYDSSFSKIGAKKYLTEAFLAPNSKKIVLCEFLHHGKFKGVDFKHGNSFFSNFSVELSKKCICGPNFKDSYFCMKLCILTYSRELISNMTIVFQNYTPKIPKSGIFGSIFDFFFVLKDFFHLNKFKAADFKYDSFF